MAGASRAHEAAVNFRARAQHHQAPEPMASPMRTDLPRSIARSKHSPQRPPAVATMRSTAAPSGSFQLVAGGELDGDQVSDRLIEASHRNGLVKDDGLRSVLATIQQRRPRRAQPSALASGCRMSAPSASLSGRRHRRIRSYARKQTPHHFGGADRHRQNRHRRRHHPVDLFVRQNPCSCSRIGAKSSRRRAKNCMRSAFRHGIIQAGFQPRPLERVQVAIDPDIASRATIRARSMDLPPADLLLDRRGHHSPAETYRKIIDAYPNAILLGHDRNAMPGRRARAWRHLSKPSSKCPQVAEADRARIPSQNARLCAGRSRSERRAHRQPATMSKTQLAERMDRPKLVGDIVTHWHKYGERRKTVAFCRQRRAFDPPPRRIREVRRARRAHRRLDTESRTRRIARAAGIRRDRACHAIAWC